MFKIYKHAASYTINDVLANDELLGVAVYTIWSTSCVIWLLDIIIQSFMKCPGFCIFLVIFFGICAAHSEVINV